MPKDCVKTQCNHACRIERRTTIAAVAIANGLTLYTANVEDFAGISGLEVVAV